MSAKKGGFVPYANEADVLRIGGLMVENRLDRITISGDIDLTADRTGLAHARELHALLGAIGGKLAAVDLPENLPLPQLKTVDNPFD